MNQVEIWLSTLVRKLSRRGRFTSVEDLTSTVRDFIAYYNRARAKPLTWTHQGKALVAQSTGDLCRTVLANRG